MLSFRLPKRCLQRGAEPWHAWADRLLTTFPPVSGASPRESDDGSHCAESDWAGCRLWWGRATQNEHSGASKHSSAGRVAPYEVPWQGNFALGSDPQGLYYQPEVQSRAARCDGRRASSLHVSPLYEGGRELFFDVNYRAEGCLALGKNRCSRCTLSTRRPESHGARSGAREGQLLSP